MEEKSNKKHSTDREPLIPKAKQSNAKDPFYFEENMITSNELSKKKAQSQEEPKEKPSKSLFGTKKSNKSDSKSTTPKEAKKMKAEKPTLSKGSKMNSRYLKKPTISSVSIGLHKESTD